MVTRSENAPWSVPFTAEEIRQAVRLIGTDAEAEATVAGVRMGCASGHGSLTQDTLLLLSLLSDDLAARVDAYRAVGRSLRPPDVEQAWVSRRDEIREVVANCQ